MIIYKIAIILVCIIAILIAGCAKESIQEDSMIGGGQIQIDCNDDSDCIRGGCSGTVCQPKDKEPIMTTCEYKAEYSCYRQIECACINNRCAWEKTNAFDKCVEEAREKSSTAPIV